MKQLFAVLIMITYIACTADTEVASTTEEAPQTARSEYISTGPIETMTIAHPVECVGRIEIPPSDLYSVHSRATGFVKTLNILPGDRVKKGALLAEIENPEFIGMQRELYELRHTLKTAQSRFDRQQQLADKNATTAKQYEEAYGQLAVTRASYYGLYEELTQQGFEIDTSTTEVTYVKTLKILSPVSGYVTAVNTNMGQRIDPHDMLCEVASRDHLHLELFVLERDINSVEIGQKVRFTTSDGSEVFNAEIVKLNAVIERATGTVMVHCHIDGEHDDQHFKGGTFARATIQTAPREVMGLPSDALVRNGNLWYGFVVDQDGFRQVQLDEVVTMEDFASFAIPPGLETAEWVRGGAYYIESD